jgi:hypothetical protein
MTPDEILVKKWGMAILYPEKSSFEERLIIAKKNEEWAKQLIRGNSSTSTGCIVPNTASQKLRQYEKQFKVSFTFPAWSHSRFQERLLRFGREFKSYKLEDARDKDSEIAVRESFCEDLVRLIENHLDDHEYITHLAQSFP